MNLFRPGVNDCTVALAVSLGIHMAVGLFFWTTWSRTPAPTPEIPIELALTASPVRTMNEMPNAVVNQDAKEKTGPPDPAAGFAQTQTQELPGKAPSPAADSQAPPTPAVPARSSESPASSENSTSDGIAGTLLIPPRVKEKPGLAMPAEAMNAALSGAVLLTVEILEDGKVGKISLSRSSGSAILDNSAREHVARWRFEPARMPQGGKAVKVLTSIWVVYGKERS